MVQLDPRGIGTAGDPVVGAAALFKSLASPLRVTIVAELAAGSCCVHDLQAALERAGRPVSQPLLSQHLKVLRHAGVVASTRRASEVTYRLVDGRVGDLVRGAIRAGDVGRGQGS